MFYTGPFWKRSGTESKLSLPKTTAGPVLDPFRTGSRTVLVNRRPIRSNFRTGTIWNWTRANIAFKTKINSPKFSHFSLYSQYPFLPPVFKWNLCRNTFLRTCLFSVVLQSEFWQFFSSGNKSEEKRVSIK